jgi:hypothetical protein
MQANEFEKQVQRIMEDLKLPPSQPVWQNIENQIRKKKERRRLVILLLLFFVLSGSLWFYLGNSNSKPVPVMGNKTKAIQKIENKLPQSESSVYNGRHKNAGSNEIVTTKTGAKIKKQVRITQQNSVASKVKEQRNNSGIKPVPVKYDNKNDLALEKTHPDKQPINPPFTANDQKSIEVVKDSTATIELVTSEKSNMLVKGTMVTDQSKKNENEKENVSKKKTKNKHWEKEISAEMGWSDYRNNLFDNRYRYNSYANPSSSAGGGQPATLDDSRRISKGVSFSAGLGLKKPLGKRSSLNVGIQYHYYSAHTKLGDAVQKDTAIRYNGDLVSVSNFYRAGTGRNYTNKFHVFEIPVSFEYRLLKNIPLSVSAGVSYGHLFRTNALSLDPASGVYYYNRKNYVSNYINIFSSAQYTWLQKAKFKIQSGPNIQINCTELRKENYSNTAYLFSVGLRTNIIFK